MSGKVSNEFEYHARTVVGYLIIIAGIIGSVWLMWWLSTHGDIVEILHEMKMSLPAWAWMVLKYGLSIVFGVVLMSIFVMLGVAVLGTGGRKRAH